MRSAGQYTQRRIEVVGPAVSSELRMTGFIAVAAGLLAIVAYVWFRFEWQFALGAIVALTHDVLLTVGIFSLFQLEFDLSIVAALLTILGYSVNDTVVVSDRIRENLRKYKRMELNELLNLSINETLSRTILTGCTAIVVLIALYIFGGEVIRNFNFAMLFGVVIGTYSSIFIAAPLLGYLGVKREWVRRGAQAGQGGRRRPARAARERGLQMTAAPARYPGRAPIDAYGNGGFRFAEMSHRGSILCLPSGIYAWPPTRPARSTRRRSRRCWPRRTRWACCCSAPGARQECRRRAAPRLRRGRHRARGDGYGRGLPHLQCAAGRGPAGRRGADRRRLRHRRGTCSASSTIRGRAWSPALGIAGRDPGRAGLVAGGADGFGLVSFLVRLLHVLAAMVWVGLIVFVNFVQLVALQAADEQARGFLHKADRARRRLVVPARLHADGGRRGALLLVTTGYLLPTLVYGTRRLRAAGARAAAVGAACSARSPCGCSCTCTSGPTCRSCWACGPAMPTPRRRRARASSCSPGSISSSRARRRSPWWRRPTSTDVADGAGSAARRQRRRRWRVGARRRARPLPCRPAGPAAGARRPAGAGGLLERARARAAARHARAGHGRDPPAVVARCAGAADAGARTGHPVADAVRDAVRAPRAAARAPARR